MATVEDVTALGLFAVRRFLDPELCDRIRTEARTAGAAPSTVVRNGQPVLELPTRRSERLDLSDETESTVDQRLREVLPSVAAHYEIDLQDCQRPQLLVYRAGDYFRPHQDTGTAGHLPGFIARRKVSVVTFLNGEAPRPVEGMYCGGSLAFYKLVENPTWETCRTPLPGEEGLLVTFPADLFHEVSPIRSGERYTIASWFE